MNKCNKYHHYINIVVVILSIKMNKDIVHLILIDVKIHKQKQKNVVI